MSSNPDFSGRTAIVTGASRGIGAATARHLASLGAQVVLAARSGGAIGQIADEIVAAGGQARAQVCDVADADAVAGLISGTMDWTGRLDLLVSNAGVIEPIARLTDSDPAGWGAAIDVNLKGVYYGLRFGIPAMLQGGGGTVVNISSGAAVSALEGWSHYCSSKAGALSLTRCADAEYREQGIRVIGLSPGTVATEMQVQIKASGINPVSRLDPSDHIPPEWVARTVAWLALPDADGFLGTDFALRPPENRALVGLPADHRTA